MVTIICISVDCGVDNFNVTVIMTLESAILPEGRRRQSRRVSLVGEDMMEFAEEPRACNSG